MTEVVEVPRDEFNRLMKIVELMNALMAAGVDNWEGYDEAFASVMEASHG